MRAEAMKSRMTFNRPVPVHRVVSAIGDKAQANTQQYGGRPYGVGLLVAGYDVRILKFLFFYFFSPLKVLFRKLHIFGY